MYEQLAASYVFDEETRSFMRQSNPWALRGITERLLEAASRGLWEAPDAKTLDQLRQVYLGMEGDLESRGTADPSLSARIRTFRGLWGHHPTRARLGGWGLRGGKAVWFAVPAPLAHARLVDITGLHAYTLSADVTATTRASGASAPARRPGNSRRCWTSGGFQAGW